LGKENGSGEDSGGWDEIERSHRVALIHREDRLVKRWSYQFEGARERGRIAEVVRTERRNLRVV
jgi:hypothetical protein